MRLITQFELAQRSDSELGDLFRAAAEELTRTELPSPDRRNALATLENISRERAARSVRAPGS